jgi:itaconate CoA-transferase
MDVISPELKALYLKRRLLPPEAVQTIASCRNLILGMSAAQPPALMAATADALKDRLIGPLALYYLHGTESLRQTLLVPELADRITPRPLFLSHADRAAIAHSASPNWIEFVPAMLHQAGRLLTEHIDPECFFVTVSPMDRHGYFSLGTNADYGASVIRKAKKVIVEVNRYMPRTFGECSVHISEVDHIVEHDQPLIEATPNPPTDVDLKIAEQIVQRIDDGDTLQIGVGGVPNAVLAGLSNHRNLGLHSELFSPAMVPLIQSGVMNGRRKSWMQHKHVFTFALGDRALYDFLDDNPAIVGYPASWVNNPDIIRLNDNMVSVNSALEIDLTGQVNSEQLGDRPFSGSGGQLDFVRGAYSARNGRSFIALRSTAKSGKVSRVVPRLLGGTVTDPRNDVQFAVTEHGCVNLKGLSIPQRARALIDIAAPEFRDTLMHEAMAIGLV